MQRGLVFVVVLLSIEHGVLSQNFDCNSDAGRFAFLRNGAAADPDCYNPILNFLESGTELTATQIEVVCQEKCAGVMLDFLRGCDSQEAQNATYFIQTLVCSYMDDGDPTTSCWLQNFDDLEGVITSCITWWLEGGTTCPNLPPGVPTNTTCADALKASVKLHGCCYRNLGSPQSVNSSTQATLESLHSAGVTVPEDFEVDVTDQDLFSACNVFLPGMCKSGIAIDTDSDAKEFDCNSDAGRLAFLQNGAGADPDCYNPVLNFLESGTELTATQIDVVCQEECAGVMLDFLRGCDGQEAQNAIYFIQTLVCSYTDDGDLTTSCWLQNFNDLEGVITSCIIWWLEGGTTCPNLPPGVPTNTTCADALKASVELHGCCYRTLGSQQSVNASTQATLESLHSAGVIVPEDFEVDVTDQDLFSACNVSLPEMCESRIADSATNLVVTIPLVALLFATIAQLFV